MGAVVGQDDLGEGQEVGATVMTDGVLGGSTTTHLGNLALTCDKLCLRMVATPFICTIYRKGSFEGLFTIILNALSDQLLVSV